MDEDSIGVYVEFNLKTSEMVVNSPPGMTAGEIKALLAEALAYMGEFDDDDTGEEFLERSFEVIKGGKE